MNERDKELWEEAAKATKGESWGEQVAFLQRFADLIRADEREACAQIVENEAARIVDLQAHIENLEGEE